MAECSYVGPDTEDGYGEGCDRETPSPNGLCVNHGGVGCPLCGHYGEQFTKEPHVSECGAGFDAFFQEKEAQHAARPFAMPGCGCEDCDKKQGGGYRDCQAKAEDGFECSGPLPCSLHPAVCTVEVCPDCGKPLSEHSNDAVPACCHKEVAL